MEKDIVKDEIEKIDEADQVSEEVDDDLDFDSPVYDPEVDDEEVLPPGEEKTEADSGYDDESHDKEEAAKTHGKEADSIDDALRERAKSAGLSDDDINEYTPKSLERTIELIEQRTAKEEDQVDTDLDAEALFELDLDEDIYDPDLIKEIKKLGPQTVKLVEKTVNKVISSMRPNNQKAEAEKVFDTLIEDLGKNTEEYKGVLGEGPGTSLDGSSNHMKNREKVIETMSLIATKRQKSGEQPLTFKELFNKAVNVSFPDIIEKAATSKLRKDLSKREKQFTNRSTNRNIKHDDPVKNAIASVREKMAQITAQNPDDDDEDF